MILRSVQLEQSLSDVDSTCQKESHMGKELRVGHGNFRKDQI